MKYIGYSKSVLLLKIFLFLYLVNILFRIKESINRIEYCFVLEIKVFEGVFGNEYIGIFLEYYGILVVMNWKEEGRLELDLSLVGFDFSFIVLGEK